MLHLLGRLGLIFKSLNLRLLTLLRASCMISLHGFVIFVESLGTYIQTVSSCKLQREQTDRSASSKLDHMLSVQKSLSKKIGLGFVESIPVSASHSTNFVPSSSSKPPVSEVFKPSVSGAKSVEVTPPKKIRVDL